MTQLLNACIAAVVLVVGQKGEQGDAQTPLISAVDAVLAAADQESEQELFDLSAKLFGEFTKADSKGRGRSIQKLVDAYVRADELQERLIPYAVLHRLPIRTDELALAVADHLVNENPESAGKWARVLSDKLGSQSLSGYIDLRNFEERIGTFPDNAETRNMLRYLFQKSPSSALLLLARHHVRGKEEYDLLVKDRRVTTFLLRLKHDPAVDRTESAKIGEVLNQMLESPHFWVRLYVVEMMIQNPVVRDESLVEKLATDKDELVSQALLDLQRPKGRIRHQAVRTPWSN